MLRLLASRLLKKKLLAAWKAARKREDCEWRAKKRRQSPERSCLPTTATLPSAMNGDFGTSPPNGWRRSDESAQVISHQPAWQRNIKIWAARNILRPSGVLLAAIEPHRLDGDGQ